MVPVAFHLNLQRAPTCHVGVAGYFSIAPVLVVRTVHPLLLRISGYLGFLRNLPTNTAMSLRS